MYYGYLVSKFDILVKHSNRFNYILLIQLIQTFFTYFYNIKLLDFLENKAPTFL